MGDTEYYFGKKTTPKDIYKLPPKTVKNIYNFYQNKLGRDISEGLMKDTMSLASRAIYTVIPVDDVVSLAEELRNDKLVQKEISNLAGFAVPKCGRLAALVSASFKVAKHAIYTTAVHLSSKDFEQETNNGDRSDYDGTKGRTEDQTEGPEKSGGGEESSTDQ